MIYCWFWSDQHFGIPTYFRKHLPGKKSCPPPSLKSRGFQDNSPRSPCSSRPVQVEEWPTDPSKHRAFSSLDRLWSAEIRIWLRNLWGKHLLFRYVSTNCHGHLLKFGFDGLLLTKVSKRFQKFGNFEHHGASCALARLIALPRTKL